MVNFKNFDNFSFICVCEYKYTYWEREGRRESKNNYFLFCFR